ncbi:MAG: hypothetical protein HYY30_07995 [Chloroflexi bacterium]|nr:hypothetical protein [Chloroflexota bacterium]
MPEGDGQNANQNNQNGQGSGNTAGAGKTFTQAELDAIIQDRLGRERDKYKDYDSLKAAATELEKIKQGQMAEQQKLQAQLDQLGKENNELKGRVQMATAERAATKAGALYPDLVAAKIPAEVLADNKKLDAAIGEIKKQYPALFGQARGLADGGAGGGRNAAGSSMNDFIRRAAGR